MSTTGYRIIKGRVSSIKAASLDDPIYNNNFVFGGTILKKSPPKDTAEKDLKDEKEKQKD